MLGSYFGCVAYEGSVIGDHCEVSIMVNDIEVKLY